MKSIRFLLAFLLTICFANIAKAQAIKDGKLYLKEEGSQWVKLTMLNQVWLRNTDNNPGSTVFGYSQENSTNIGIRRYRVQFMGQLTDRVFFYSQFGENNFSAIADRKLGFFVHDAIGEYAIDKKKLSIGAGLTAWGGLSRFSAPSVGTILGVDAPLFLQSTNDVTDQFLRKLSVYAKGKLGKLDYRITMAEPMAFQKSGGYNATLSQQANFSSRPAKKQWNGYFMYQFKDEESNMTPYATGTYLGKKKVFNIGAGFVFQPDAMWHSGNTLSDTVSTNMVQLAADIYYDAPLNEKGTSLSLYGNFTHFNFGPNYIRNLGAMNPANGTTNKDILNGSGNNFPAYGTGNVLYAQAGYKLKDNLIGKTTIMPYISLQHANYERLKDRVNFIDLGCSWLLSSQTSKLTAAYQSRPLHNNSGEKIDRKGSVILQYQVYFN
ncbi:MAG: hypothetical protein ACI9IP_002123 [Arcticibacterium sp.]|jgi:hypothetical protein